MKTPGPVIQGLGNLVMECGECAATLVHGDPDSKVKNVVIKCYECGSFNELVE